MTRPKSHREGWSGDPPAPGRSGCRVSVVTQDVRCTPAPLLGLAERGGGCSRVEISSRSLSTQLKSYVCMLGLERCPGQGRGFRPASGAVRAQLCAQCVWDAGPRQRTSGPFGPPAAGAGFSRTGSWCVRAGLGVCRVRSVEPLFSLIMLPLPPEFCPSFRRSPFRFRVSFMQGLRFISVLSAHNALVSSLPPAVGFPGRPCCSCRKRSSLVSERPVCDLRAWRCCFSCVPRVWRCGAFGVRWLPRSVSFPACFLP